MATKKVIRKFTLCQYKTPNNYDDLIRLKVFEYPGYNKNITRRDLHNYMIGLVTGLQFGNQGMEYCYDDYKEEDKNLPTYFFFE